MESVIGWIFIKRKINRIPVLKFRSRWALTNEPGDCSFNGVNASPDNPYKAVLFDLDGTLIDQFRVIYRCYQYALDKLGLEPVTYEKVRSSVGGSISITFGKLIPQEYVEEAVEHFREKFDQCWHEDTDILPGAEWLLKELHERGVRLCVFTNKEGDRSRRILSHLGMDHYLDGIYGTLDTPWRKPEPEFTQYVIEQMQADPDHACMVGDSPYDVDSASAGNIPCYTVATGSHSMEQLHEETEAAGVFKDLYQLGNTIFRLPLPETIAY
jgi:phosphoglycolate phosphatase